MAEVNVDLSGLNLGEYFSRVQKGKKRRRLLKLPEKLCKTPNVHPYSTPIIKIQD